MDARILMAGDVGGTKTLLRLAEWADGRAQTLQERRYENRDFANFGGVLEHFLAEEGARPDAACVAIAAPVSGRRARLTNLDWTIDADSIQSALEIPSVHLINDFEAVALGIGELEERHLAVLQAGRPAARAPRVVLGAGTGLGVAWLVWNGRRYAPLATEGGHMDFAPSGELQVNLLKYAVGKFGHVSWERMLSGPGLVGFSGSWTRNCPMRPWGWVRSRPTRIPRRASPIWGFGASIRLRRRPSTCSSRSTVPSPATLRSPD